MDVKTAPEYSRVYAFGHYRLEVAERRLLQEDKPVALAGKAFDLLQLLIEAAGHLKTRDELIKSLWPDTVVEEHSLTSRVSAVRRALNDEDEIPRYIETVRGQGYRFIAAVAVEGGEVRPLPRPRRILRVASAALATLVVIGAGLIWSRVEHVSSIQQPGAVQPRSVAVLPFENLSTDPANAYFANGIQDMILTKLAGVKALRVVSRTSSEQFQSHPVDLQAVSTKLGVAAVLEGSVQKAGDQVLVNVQLIDARTDNHIWAQTYRRTLDNVFNVEGDVADQVATAMEAQLLPEEAARILSTPTRDPQAYDLFLQAEYIAIPLEEGNAKDPLGAAQPALRLYRGALARDPGFALAEARYSYLQSYMYWADPNPPAAVRDGARQSAERALALAPSLPQAHMAMGFVFYWGYRDYPRALAEFEAAQRDEPNNGNALGAIGYILRREGKWDEALQDFRNAASLDLLNPRWPVELGVTLTQLRRYTEAEYQFDRALAANPQNVDAIEHKAWVLLLEGKLPEAGRLLASVPHDLDTNGTVSSAKFEAAWLARDPDAALASLKSAPPWVIGFVSLQPVPISLLGAQAWALKGDRARARGEFLAAHSAIQARLDADTSDTNNAGYLSSLGRVAAGLGDRDKAVAAGQESIDKQLLSSQDALNGPTLDTVLAETYAQFGEAKPAVRLLDQLMATPAGWTISLPLLELDPVWDPIRADPGFKALLKRYANPG